MDENVFPLRPRGAAADASRLLGCICGLEVSDRTDWPRFGLKGPGSAAWLQEQGLDLPDVNRVSTAGDMRILRLGWNDIALLSVTAAAPNLDALRATWDGAMGARGYSAWREESWAWLALSGPTLDGVLSRLCAVDLRQTHFPNDALAQTRVAGMDAVVLRDGPSADILFDIAATSDMLGRIAHAAQTEGGL